MKLNILLKTHSPHVALSNIASGLAISFDDMLVKTKTRDGWSVVDTRPGFRCLTGSEYRVSCDVSIESINHLVDNCDGNFNGQVLNLTDSNWVNEIHISEARARFLRLAKRIARESQVASAA